MTSRQAENNRLDAKVRNERLRHLTTVLQRVVDTPELRERFDMDFYITARGEIIANDFKCGFAGCAIGWAASDKTFQDEGFILDDKWDIVMIDPKTSKTLEQDTSEAAEKFFQIHEDLYYFLFEPGTYNKYDYPFRYGMNKDAIPDELFLEDGEEDIEPQLVIDRINFAILHHDTIEWKAT